MRRDKLIRRLDGIGCNPAVVQGTREDLMERISEARKSGLLTFPESNGPILWPRFQMRETLVVVNRATLHDAQAAA
jgi:hypothetical protein